MNMRRRTVLKALGLGTGGFALGIPGISMLRAADEQQSDGDGFRPDAFLHLAEDGVLSFVFPRAEMGQGSYHGLATIVAEELEIDPSKLRVLQAPADTENYRNPLVFNLQVTGGSTAIVAHYEQLRQCAATMREALLQAAAADTDHARSSLRLEDGFVHGPDGNAIPWQNFAATAANSPLPSATPKSPKDFRFLGAEQPRIDALAKSTGTAVYGLDIELEGMLRAVVVRSPVFGGEVTGYNADDVLAMPGVTHVVEVHSGVAVVAEQLWFARKGAEALKVDWEFPETLSSTNSADLPALFRAAAEDEDGQTVLEEGDAQAKLAESDRVFEREYFAPYLAHATMEPMTVAIDLSEDGCDLWTGTQGPDGAQAIVRSKTGLSKEQVRIHNCMLGGGFGRRGSTDYIREAVEVAQEIKRPVHVVWSREDDLQTDYYRPASLMKMRAAVDSSGRVSALEGTRVGPQINTYFMRDLAQIMTAGVLPESFARWLGRTAGGIVTNNFSPDPSSVEGLVEDYDIEDRAAYQVTVDPGLRLGFWRSVGHSYSAFAKESLLDEIANNTGQDPVALRLAQLEHNPRLAGTLRAVASAADWEARRGAGEAVGVASHSSFGTAVSEIALIAMDDGKIRVRKVWCAVDCGYAINPNVVRAQMESGIIYGLSAALHGEITLQAGQVQQTNFDNYPVTRIDEAPEIEVIIVNSSDRPLGGAGEPGTPPIAPAVANAVFAATGQRLRSLPLRPV